MSFDLKYFSDTHREIYAALNIHTPFNGGAYPKYWLVDDARGFHFISFGGRGDLPAGTGEPPDYYALASRDGVLYLGIRFRGSKWDSERGGEVCHYKVEEAWGDSIFEINILEEALRLHIQSLAQQVGAVSRVIGVVVGDIKYVR